MPPIQTRDQARHEESNRGPPQCPSRSPRQLQSAPPREKQKEAQGKVANKMSAFSNVVMHYLEVRRIHTHKKVEEWIKKPALMLCRKCSGRFKLDEPSPQKRGNPRFD